MKIMLLQDIVRKWDPLVIDLRKGFGDLNFIALDSRNFLGGFIICFNGILEFVNHFSMILALFIIVHSKSMDLPVTLLNLFGPFNGKQVF